MSRKPTQPVYKNCPICKEDFPVCPPGKSSRIYPPNETEFCSPEHAAKGRYRHGRSCKRFAPEEAIYLAGFMDGEGSIILYRRRDTANVSLRVNIANTNLPAIERIRDMAKAGAISITKRHSNLHKTGYLWQINSDTAVSFLEQILPHLYIKKSQAQLAIDFAVGMRDPATKSNKQWQVECLSKMKTLNKRGP